MRRILVVDDDDDFTAILKIKLLKIGYPNVRLEVDPLKAAAAFSRGDCADLALIDMTMPEMTGIQLITEIRKINLTIPVILCTGYSETVTARTTEEFGINGFLMKPVPLNELAQIVSEVLRTPPHTPQA